MEIQGMMKRKKVFFTVDVEGPVGKDAINKLVFGNIAGKTGCGIGLIMDLLDQYEVKGIFFVDMAEAWEYGEKSIGDVVETIKSRGHDIGMHIHPDRMADKKRRYLWQYSYNEQEHMLSECTALFEKFAGNKPVTFRAGRYGLNNDTLDILDKLGYLYDFSEFYGQKKCHISPPITCNKIVKYKNLTEIPVTSYKSFRCGSYFRYDKIDASMPYAEYKYIMDRIALCDSVDAVSMFAHSFSFLSWRRNPDKPKFIRKEYDKVKRMLQYIANSRDFEFSHYLDFGVNTLNVENKIVDTDFSGGAVPYIFFMFRAFRVFRDRMLNNI